MSNLINFLVVNPCHPTYGSGFGGMCNGVIAWFWQIFYGLLGTIYKVLGLFADLLNVAFYIFAGVELNSQKVDGTKNLYAIEVGTNGDRKNILDYFVLSESMQKAYLWMALLGLLLVVVFTIYKIVKQDYFDRAGPRSKGPIFRNVAISCISFLLVIPIFWIIIHVSSLLAVAVMSNLGMDVNTFAGTKIFMLSWSDNGETFRMVNNMLHGNGDVTKSFNFMNDMHPDSIFTLVADGEYVRYDDSIMKQLNKEPWPGTLTMLEYPRWDAETQSIVYDAVQPTFYWYIYLVGIIVGIKSLYTLVLAMIQRIFKLMGLFLVAPSPISQYVLDDGQKFKSWLAQSIQEGLRLVVACMSFAIYLIVLNLVKDINFITAFINATGDKTQYADNFNVSTDLLSYEREFIDAGFITLADSGEDSNTLQNVIQEVGNYIENGFFALVNAFFKILLLMGAGGAIIDLDQVLTPLISGGRSSLDAGQTGKSVDAGVQAVKQVGVAMAGSVVGGVMGGIASGKSRVEAISQAKKEARAEAADEQNKAKESVEKNGDSGASGGNGGGGSSGDNGGGGSSGGNGGGGSSDTNDGAGAPNSEDPDNNGANSPSDDGNNGGGDDNGDDNADGDNGGSDGKADGPKGGDAGASSSTTSKPRLAERMQRSTLRIGLRLGRVGLGLAKGVGKTAATVGLSTTGALKGAVTGTGRALKKGLSMSASMLTTAVLGKEAGKAFLDARAEASAGAKKSVGKTYERAKASEYQKIRKEQMEAAAQEADSKAAEVEEQSESVSNAVNSEQQAVTQLNEENDKAYAAEKNAEQATQEFEAEDGKKSSSKKTAESIKNSEESIQNSQKAIETSKSEIEQAKKANENIRANYGTKEQMKSRIAEFKKDGNLTEAGRYSAMLQTYTENESAIKEHEASIQTHEEKIAGHEENIATQRTKQEQRTRMIDACTGKGGTAAKYGVSADMSLEKARTTVAAVDTSKMSEQELAEFNNYKAGLESATASTYDSKGAVAAREANDSYAQAAKRREKAQKTYDKAHAKTQQEYRELQGRMQAYSNSVSLVSALDQTTENSKYGGQQTTKYEYNKDGQLVKTQRASRFANEHRKGQSDVRKAKIAKVSQKAQQTFARANANNGAVQELDSQKNLKIKTNAQRYEEWLNATEASANEGMQQAGESFAQQVETNSEAEMTLITKKGVDARSALRADGTIDTSKVSLAQAQEVRSGASAAAVANFKISPQADKKTRAAQQRILNSCMVDGVIDFAAIEQERSGHSSKYVQEALDKLKADYISHASAKLSNIGEQRDVVTVGDFVQSHTRDDGTYDIAKMQRILNASARNGGTDAGLGASIATYAQERKVHSGALNRVNAARASINAVEQMRLNEMEQVVSDQSRLQTVNSQVGTLNRIIAQAQTGQKVILTTEEKQMIGSTCGLVGGTIRTTNPAEISKYASQARDIKRNEQVEIIRRSEERCQQSTQLQNDLAAMMNSVMANAARPQRSPQQVNNNVTNNNVVNNNTTAPQGQYWFNGEQRSGSSAETPSVTGSSKSRDMADMYERIQAEGIKHMELMLEQMRVENRSMAKEVSSVKKTVEEIKED